MPNAETSSASAAGLARGGDARRAGIAFDRDSRTFELRSPGMAYLIRISDEGDLLHEHWGAPTPSVRGARPKITMASIHNAFDTGRRELPDFGRGDTRPISAIELRGKTGHTITKLAYESHEIFTGKPRIPKLPSAYAEPGDGVETLVVRMRDGVTRARVDLHYSLFPAYDAVARHTELRNEGDAAIKIQKLASWSMDMKNRDLRLLHLSGAWAREMSAHVTEVGPLTLSIESRYGNLSSHEHNPSFALLEGDVNEAQGRVFGLSLVYSGSFKAEISRSALGQVRTVVGLNNGDFERTVEPGEAFSTPECIGIFSGEGLGGMSRRYHRLFSERMRRGPLRDVPIPTLVNSWESYYFSFHENDIVSLGALGRELGLDMVVMDDGWFGKRENDRTSLGDWFENRTKLPGGLEGLAARVAQNGGKLGLWIEPEMVSRKSELFAKHPDWCIHIPEDPSQTDGAELRNQLMLDLSRAEVSDFILETLSALFSRASVSYVKWDCNRFITDGASQGLAPERQRELSHRYMENLYSRVLDPLTRRFPEILFEACASGGGRLDAGMMPYMGRFWTSDNTDAVSRLEIMYGASLFYPPHLLGSHHSAVPNHQTGRVTPATTRDHIAMSGALGYELNLAKLDRATLDSIKENVTLYTEVVRPLLQGGDLYRLRAPHARLATTAAAREETNWPAWMFVSRDERRSSAVVFGFQVLAKPSLYPPPLRLAGLDPRASYALPELDLQATGAELMEHGLELAFEGDFTSKLLRLERIDG